MDFEVHFDPKRSAVRMSRLTRRVLSSVGAAAVALSLTACSGSADSSPAGRAAQAAPSQQPSSEAPAGSYKFGQTITFDSGSTLVVENPVDFQPAPDAVIKEKKPVYVKFKATFVNNTKEAYDPTLTTASVLAEGEEGELVSQEDLDAPVEKVLPGKSVTWWMGYGVKSRKDLQLGVSVDFSDRATVVITA